MIVDLLDTTGLDYVPLEERWVCDHGSDQGGCNDPACRDLPWDNTDDLRLAPFEQWARWYFRQIVGPYDRDEVDEMPDEAFDAYTPDAWIFAEALDGLVRLLAGRPS